MVPDKTEEGFRGQLDTNVQPRSTIPDQSPDPLTIDSLPNLVNISLQMSFPSGDKQNETYLIDQYHI